MTLPTTSEEYSFRWNDTEFWKSIVNDLLKGLGISYSAIERPKGGSNIVFRIDDKFFKLCPPFTTDYDCEVRSLPLLRSLPVQIPQLLRHGALVHGWNYVLISSLDGSLVEDVWKEFSIDEKIFFMHDLGRLAHDVHCLSAAGFPTRSSWSDFITAQLSRAYARHYQLKLPDHLLRKLNQFLEAHIHFLDLAPQIVPLTGEYVPENMMVTKTAGGWRLSGMFDFGDMMTGDQEYDLLGPTTFYAAGDVQLQKEFFRAYYGEDFIMTRKLSTRLMMLLLLHRFSNLKVQLVMPNWEMAPDFESLAEMVWPLF